MPNKAEHCLQANHNLSFLGLIDGTERAGEFPDWVVTVSFYSSVHLIEAAIAEADYLFIHAAPGASKVKIEKPGHTIAFRPQVSGSVHSIRQKLLTWNTKYFPGCAGPYAELLEMSIAARYNAQKIHPSQATQARKCLSDIQRMLATRVN
jgi:hypothetical protein